LGNRPITGLNNNNNNNKFPEFILILSVSKNFQTCSGDRGAPNPRGGEGQGGSPQNRNLKITDFVDTVTSNVIPFTLNQSLKSVDD
jgi:hypothetical protein